MSNTKKIVWVVVIVVVIAVIAIVWYEHPTGTPGTSGAAVSGVGSNSGIPVTPTSSPTRTAAPTNVTVPNEGATSTSPSVAVPVVQGAGDPAGNVSYRSFSINIENGSFSPDTVIVNQGDTVNLELTAVGGNYGFTQPDYGFNAAIPDGKTQTIQFQALESGNFTFYCGSCGGPAKGPVGHIIVVAK